MDTELEEEPVVSLDVRNVGGIGSSSMSFVPGVTVLAGRNATNRTSLLRAIMAACGSDDVSMKADADEASVTLEVDDVTYERTLTRRDGRLHSRGEPYLDDPELADLFAFLVESNEARRTIERGGDVRDVIMRPVDTDEIEAAIDRLRGEKRELQDELAELDRLEDRLAELETERAGLSDSIEETRSELERTAAEAADVGDADGREELEERLDDLQSARSSLEDVRYELDTEEESLVALREQRDDLETELSELPEPTDDELERIETELEELRRAQGATDADVDELQGVIQFNREMLDGAREGLSSLPADDGGSGSVTDRLVEDETVACWTCGTEVASDQIEATIDRLVELKEEKLRESAERESEIESLRAERERVTDRLDRRRELEERLETLEEEIENRAERIEDLERRRDELEADVESLEAEIEALEDARQDEHLELNRRASELQFELDRLEAERRDVTEELEAIRERLDRRDEIEAELSDVESRLRELRTRVESVERGAVDAFNDHMDAILDLLDYENVDRIWLERIEGAESDRSGAPAGGTIELHVVRSTESGAVYEDTVDHLSESEREVTGLVFALAGYLAHDVHEAVPFILLDSLEAIDADRIAALIEYLEDFCDYLIVALLSEDAEALPDSYSRVESI